MGGFPLKNSGRGAELPGLEKDAIWRLCLLVAPAGAGKTRALRRWAKRNAAEPGTRLAWLSLLPEHNRPIRFLEDLKASLGIPLFKSGRSGDMDAREESKARFEGELVEVINWMVESNAPVILVLDNYEIILNTSIHEGVKLLVEYLPPQARLIITSQREPPLQQARLRARRQLLELGPDDLLGG